MRAQHAGEAARQRQLALERRLQTGAAIVLAGVVIGAIVVLWVYHAVIGRGRPVAYFILLQTIVSKGH